MNCQGEEQLNRLTLTGWLLIVVHAAVFAVVGPMLAVNFLPPALITRRTLVITIMASGGGCFLLCKSLLEKWGVTVIRPPQTKSVEK
jgi:hypothetical protein